LHRFTSSFFFFFFFCTIGILFQCKNITINNTPYQAGNTCRRKKEIQSKSREQQRGRQQPAKVATKPPANPSHPNQANSAEQYDFFSFFLLSFFLFFFFGLYSGLYAILTIGLL
jgi:hypothetical protein